MSARIQAELLALRDSNGIIDARRAVDWAKQHQDSALYQALEWDDATAAIEYRISQVRRLIAVHIVDAEGHRQVVSLSVDRQQGGGYRSVQDVLSVDDLRAVMLSDALEELQRVQRKYEYLQELAKVWEAAQQVEQETRPRRRRRAA